MHTFKILLSLVAKAEVNVSKQNHQNYQNHQTLTVAFTHFQNETKQVMLFTKLHHRKGNHTSTCSSVQSQLPGKQLKAQDKVPGHFNLDNWQKKKKKSSKWCLHILYLQMFLSAPQKKKDDTTTESRIQK